MGDRPRDSSESRGCRSRGGIREQRRDDRDDRRKETSRDRRRDERRDRCPDKRDCSHSRDRKAGGISAFVRNLAFSVTVNDLRGLFSRYGDIRDVYVPLVSSLTLSLQTLVLCHGCVSFSCCRIMTPSNHVELLSSNSRIVAMR